MMFKNNQQQQHSKHNVYSYLIFSHAFELYSAQVYRMVCQGLWGLKNLEVSQRIVLITKMLRRLIKIQW